MAKAALCSRKGIPPESSATKETLVMKKTSQKRALPVGVIAKISEFRTKLYESIQETCTLTPYFCYDPTRNFTRTRQLPFDRVILHVLAFLNHSLQGEIFDLCDDMQEAPTKSALIQQRHKIRPDAFHFLFHDFMSRVKPSLSFQGFSLLACDGSVINLPRNPNDSETSVQAKPGAKSYNRIHLNALYDLVNKVYVDFRIDDGAHMKELDALYAMAGCIHDPEHTILTADRGYGCFNTFACLLHHHCHFVIRVKDITSATSLTRQLNLPDGEFDRDIDIILTKSHKKMYLEDPHYVVLYPNDSFDYFDDSGFANLKFRAVRLRLSTGEYETVFTDLPRDTFSFDAISQIYHLRWGIETSFRELKYGLDLIYLHSKQYEFLIQELISRIIMYNVYSLMSQCVPEKRKTKHKHVYRVNFMAAIDTLRRFLLNGCVDILSRLIYNMNPVRNDRSVPRGNLHDTKPAKPFNYR